MIFLRNHKNCSKKRPPAKMQVSQRQRCRSHNAGGENVKHKEIPRASPGFHLLRRQSSQPGPRRSRRACVNKTSYDPRGRSLDRRGCDGALSYLRLKPLGKSLGPEWHFFPTQEENVITQIRKCVHIGALVFA
ncbi:hypothetical protein TNCV_3708401 [Trichonephila clavipes]|nr:hypothetical protein TNCV_3708401 [Trichonephila clavipes]